jgi:hypothetical protein
MREPGALTALGEKGRAAWNTRVSECFDRALKKMAGAQRFLLPEPDEETRAITGPDWTGMPARVSACLGRKRALRLLDWESDGFSEGGRLLQEEYLEWRVVRSEERISRVEITTELPEYWGTLAAYEPEHLLETIADFAGETSVSPRAIYGTCDPFAAGVTPEEREQAFTDMMLPPRGRSMYNNGERALCCMAQETNTLEALVRLAVATTSPRVVHDVTGRVRCLTCSEAIPLLGKAAQLGRASDSILVERLGQLAFEGRRVAFDDPVGVYIQSVEHSRLRTPTGGEVPPEWFTFSRGLAPEASAGGHPRYQRVTFQAPPGEELSVGDLIDVATERPIGHGGEIADLVQLAVFFRVSETDRISVDQGKPLELAAGIEDPQGCAEIRDYERRFNRARMR